MGKKKKEIKIIKNDFNKEDYIFVNDDLIRELKQRFIHRK